MIRSFYSILDLDPTLSMKIGTNGTRGGETSICIFSLAAMIGEGCCLPCVIRESFITHPSFKPREWESGKHRGPINR